MFSFKKLWVAALMMGFIGLCLAMGNSTNSTMDIPALFRSIVAMGFLFTSTLLILLAMCLKEDKND
jgi:hypothetical protein